MAGILGAGGSQAKTPRYTQISLQTSAQGLGIPIVYGQNRLGTNLIWYNDFKSRTTKQSGKGGASAKTYYYSCAVIMALCEGPILNIGQVWAGTALTTLSALGLTLFTGTATQAPWSYVISKHPTQALSYARTAYVAASSYQLGTSPSLPSHNFEVSGILYGSALSGTPDANPADIINDFLTNQQYGIGLTSAQIAANLANYKTYCQSQGMFFSPVLVNPEQVTMTIKRWAQLTNAFIFWSGNQLQFVPLGDTVVTANGVTYTPQITPVYDLTYDDFIADPGADPITVSFVDPADGYNQVQLDINDRSNAYNNTSIRWQDQTSIDQYGELQSNVISASEICVQSIGQTCAALIGKRSVYVTKTYVFKLSRRFVFMEPGDIYTVTDPNIGLMRFPVRIINVASGKDKILTVTAEEFPAGIGTVAAYGQQGSSANAAINTQVPPGNVNAPVIFEPNAAQTGGEPQVWVGASGGPNWGGAQVYISFNGTSYSEIGQLEAGLLQGTVISALATHADPDTTDTLHVDFTESEGVMPSTATQADADALRTIILVDNEVLAYGTATPGTLNSYSTDLTYLRRGQYGTTIASHAAGAPAARIDQNLMLEYNLPAQYVGQELYFKFVSFNAFGNAPQDISTVPVYTYTPVGTAFTLGAPGVPSISAASTTQSDGTTILTLTGSWTASAGPNLGSYEVQWSTNGGTSWTNDTVVGSTALGTILAPALASTNYLMRVRAISQNGQAQSAWEVSASTNSGALTSVPIAPTGISVTAVAGGALVNWTPSVSASATGNQVRYGTSSTFSASTVWPITTSGTGLLLSGLAVGVTYYFWVQAYNNAGASSPDGPVSCSPAALGGSLTIESAGTITSTIASTLDFAGAVTVTGTGASQTITVPGIDFSGTQFENIVLGAGLGGTVSTGTLSLSNSGVLALGSAVGTVALGSNLSLSGNTLNATGGGGGGVTSIGGQTGSIALGSGLSMSGTTIEAIGTISGGLVIENAGTSIGTAATINAGTGLTAAMAGGVATFSGGGGGGGWLIKTTSYTASSGDLIIATGASSQVITLPSSPATDAIVFIRVALLGLWSNAVGVSGNGKNITGDLFTNQTSIRLGLDGQEAGFLYDGTVWRAFSSQGPVKLCPKAADFTWTNQGTATATDTADGLVMYDPNTGQPSNRMLTTAVSGTFNSLTVILDYAAEYGNYTNSGPIIGNTSSGKFALQFTQQPYIYYIGLFNNPTSNSSFPINGVGVMGPFNVFNWSSNGTNIYAKVGRNASGLYQTYSATIASFLSSITMVGISVDGGATGGCQTTFSHFHQE